ncbi:hypothetical protein HDV02_003778 [Globomyces sp. JEL0801]|nr:hypothetical protein HDV02_003778 [Globomyces sp. JEL0801]
MNPSGALLYASLPNKNIDQVWKSLSHALAGLFCASLNFMDAPLVATPSLAFSMLASQNHSLRYSSLPFEAVCTENLTPWDWTLKSLFKNELQNVCPFADESTLTIDVPSNLDIAVSNDIGELPFTIVDGVRRVSLDLLTYYTQTEVNKNVNQTKMNEFLFTPAIDRVRPTVMEFQLTLPPHTTTSLSIDYECAFIKVSEHHPDANHGFEIGTGVVQFNDTIFYTESLLIRLPTPDFSMPYNVITLTCTVLSLFFGSIFNMLTRRFLPIVNKSYVAKVDTDDEEDDDEEEDEKEVDDEVELKKRK